MQKIKLIGFVLAAVLVLTGCARSQDPAPLDWPPMPNENANTQTSGNQNSNDTVINLSELNGSGLTGTATISDLEGKAKVEIRLTGDAITVPHPAHIHSRSCADIGAVKYPLNTVVSGNSVTLLPVSVATVLGGGKLSVNVHKSAQELSTYVACGDIPTTGSDESANVNQPPSANKNTANTNTTQAQAKTFTVNGSNFAFDLKEIKVKKGDRVTINFVNKEGFHDWVLDEFDVRTPQLQAGKQASVVFTANQTGTFEYYCSVGQHRQMGMVGKLIVE